MTTLRPLAMMILVCSLAACTGLSYTQQRTLTGGALGAAAGAGISAMTGGDPVTGAAIGGAGGAATGYIISKKHN